MRLAQHLLTCHSTMNPERVVHDWLVYGDDEALLDLSGYHLLRLPRNFPYDRVRNLNCSGNYLTSLTLPHTIFVDCSDNRLVLLDLPSVRTLYCERNALGRLYLPRAEFILCSRNDLVFLEAPRAVRVECEFNSLRELSLPSANWIGCGNNNQLQRVVAPMCLRLDCSYNNRLSMVTVNESGSILLYCTRTHYLAHMFLGKRLKCRIEHSFATKQEWMIQKRVWNLRARILRKKTQLIDESNIFGGVHGLGLLVAQYT